nr:MATE family efflux transporter [uncultured Cellulosilyticum sp.]
MRKMTEGNIARHLLTYAIPLILGNFFQLTYNAVDSIIIGKYAGEEALAAVGAANPVMTIMILGVSGIGIGASVLMSKFYGADDIVNLKREVSTTIVFGGICSFVVFLVGMALSGHILKLMNVPAEIMGIANTYLRIIFIGFLFTFQYNVMSAALRSVGDSKTPVKFLAIASVLNAGLDILFIYGLHMGVVGAGLATVIAEGVSAILCFGYVYMKVPELQIKPSEFIIDKKLLRETIQSGSITALQQSCQPIGKVFIQSVINTQGISAIAAFNAVNRVDDFACIPEQSISHGMMTCIAQNKGAGNEDRIRETLRVGLMLEACYWVLICMATLLLKTSIMKLFASEKSAEMITIGVQYLTIMAFFYLLPGFTNGMQGYFRGIGKMRVTLIGTLIQISIRVIVVFGLVPRIGLNGAAYACLIGWSCMLLYEGGYYVMLMKAEKANKAVLQAEK